MASSHSHDGGPQDGGLPLKSFSKNVPPGWIPGDPRYPLKLYTQLLRLWWRQTDIPEGAAGPTMAGRLRGTALQYAMRLKANRLDLVVGGMREMVGDELLSQPSHDEWIDPISGQVYPAEVAGQQC